MSRFSGYAMERGAYLPLYAQMPPGGMPPQPASVPPIAPEQPPSPAIPTPQGPAPGTGPLIKPPYLEPKPKVERSKLILLLAVMSIMILFAVSVVYIKYFSKPGPTTTTSTTTIGLVNQQAITGCRVINAPGNYTFIGNVVTKTVSGTCIQIASSNVNINCHGYSLQGSGPYSGVPPFSYGIRIIENGVSLTDCQISNFSYGVFAGPASNLNIYNDNISANYMSDLYLSNVQSSTIRKNILLQTTSNQGALFITNGSINNNISNNTVHNTLNYGINVNASGNNFYNNLVTGAPSGFYCSVQNGLTKSNNAYGNTCKNNTACGFVTCSGTNLLDDLSNIQLQNNVNGCGSINSPGVYTLQSQINMNQFINTSNPLAQNGGIACIYIKSGSVTLNCKGFSITNATTAIVASGKANITINNCRLYSKYYGVNFENVSDSYVYNTYATGSMTGILLSHSGVDLLSNITLKGNEYGLTLANASSATVNKFVADNNTYGLFLTSSLGNIFSNGEALGNSNLDVYASIDSANASYNYMSKTVCNVTNAAWAPCQNHVVANLQYTPVTACQVISRPGSYLLNRTIYAATNNCMTITASNVKFACNGHRIGSATATTQGSAISISGASNVMIYNCTINNFAYGVVASNSSKVNVTSINDFNSGTGVSFTSVSFSRIASTLVNSTSSYGIFINGSHNDSVLNNRVNYAITGGGIGLYNTSYSKITNNSGANNYDGISLTGISQNNTVENNNMHISSNYDYYCSPQNGYLYSEHGNINNGASKLGCNWMAVIPPGYTGISCVASFTPNYVVFSTDQYYMGGLRCFTAFNNATTLNCQGHTIVAPDGGTLLFANGSKGSIIENCYIKGFTQVAASKNGGINLINDSIYSNSSSANEGAVINISGSSNEHINYNNITAPYGIRLASSVSGTVSHNRLNSTSIASLLYNTSAIAFNNNFVTKNSGDGIVLNSSTGDSFQYNNFYGVVAGLLCVGTSTGPLGGQDQGGNFCSSRYQCSWISASNSTCH